MAPTEPGVVELGVEVPLKTGTSPPTSNLASLPLWQDNRGRLSTRALPSWTNMSNLNVKASRVMPATVNSLPKESGRTPGVTSACEATSVRSIEPGQVNPS